MTLSYLQIHDAKSRISPSVLTAFDVIFGKITCDERRISRGSATPKGAESNFFVTYVNLRSVFGSSPAC